jgi:periplasmic protein CpxP/Spy
MKTRFLISALAVLVITGSVFATTTTRVATRNCAAFQPPQGQKRTPEERAKRETEWMKTDLTLMEKQIPLVDTINLKYAKKQDEMRKQMEGQDREAFRPKMEEMQKQKNEELKSVLTEDQLKKYIELLPQRRGPRAGGRQGEAGPRPEGNGAPQQ